jgi:hypothetical protein
LKVEDSIFNVSRFLDLDQSHENRAFVAIDTNVISGFNRDLTKRAAFVFLIADQVTAPHDAGFPKAVRDDGGMGCQAAPGGQQSV